MNLSEIKIALGVEQLNLNTAEDKDGNKTEWMRHWDNAGRIAISIHKDTIKACQDGTPSTLDIQTETRTGSKGDYTAKRIVMYTPAEVTL